MPDPKIVLAGIGLAAAAGIAYLATRTAGPVQMPAFTEQAGIGGHGRGCLHYPSSVAPNLAYTLAHGFAPTGEISDPQAMAQPGEEAW